jgi:hypothetical protein
MTFLCNTLRFNVQRFFKDGYPQAAFCVSSNSLFIGNIKYGYIGNINFGFIGNIISRITGNINSYVPGNIYHSLNTLVWPQAGLHTLSVVSTE